MNFGRSEKVKKTICRSLGRIDKMDFFWGKVKQWKKRSVEVLGVLLFVGRNDKKDFFLGKLGKVKKWKKRSVEAQVIFFWVRKSEKNRFFEG